jgi:hypothetical protein
MLYREVVSSSVLPLSAYADRMSVSDLESFFDNFFYSKGPEINQAYKRAALQSNSTFLKDIFKIIGENLKDKTEDQKEKLLISLIINTINNQLLMLEEMIKENNSDTVNAIICGVVLKKIKLLFS